MAINTVIFDMGGTIEDLNFTEESRRKVQRDVYELLKSKAPEVFRMPFEAFREELLSGYKAYKSWGIATKLEETPEGIWGDWYMKGIDGAKDVVVPLADRLTEIWETGYYHRSIKPEAHEALNYLKENGYKIGVISNTSSRTQPLNSMDEYGIRQYFSCIFLSAAEGTRKPNRKMFDDAAEALGVRPDQCMYVGDQIAKDIIGSKEAGYGAAVLISSLFTMEDPNAGLIDYQIEKLTDIIPILEEINSAVAVNV